MADLRPAVELRLERDVDESAAGLRLVTDDVRPVADIEERAERSLHHPLALDRVTALPVPRDDG